MIQVDYFMSHGSPWTFLGHKRLGEIIKKYKVKLNMLPVNYGEIFPISGGLPVSKRPVQRQKIRLQELKRWSKFLDINLIPQPTSFPSKSMLPSLLIIASQIMKTNKDAEKKTKIEAREMVKTKKLFTQNARKAAKHANSFSSLT